MSAHANNGSLAEKQWQPFTTRGKLRLISLVAGLLLFMTWTRPLTIQNYTIPESFVINNKFNMIIN